MTIESVLRCLPTLKRLSKAKSVKERRKLLRKCKKCILDSISEISKNVLVSNVPLSKYRYKKLYPHRKYIRELASKGLYKRKRYILNQKGGLLIPAITLLAKIAA